MMILMMKGHDGQGDATTQNTRRRCLRVMMMMVPDLLLRFLLMMLITISILIWRMDGKDHILFIDGRGSETRFHENGR